MAKALKNFIRSWLYQEDIKAKVRHVEVDKFGLLLLHNSPHHLLPLSTPRRKFAVKIFLLSFWCVFFSELQIRSKIDQDFDLVTSKRKMKPVSE